MREHSLYDLNPLKSHLIFCVAQHMLILVNVPMCLKRLYALNHQVLCSMSGIRSSLLIILFIFSVILSGFLVYLNPSVTKRGGLKSPTIFEFVYLFSFYQFNFIDFAAILSTYRFRILYLTYNANLLTF